MVISKDEAHQIAFKIRSYITPLIKEDGVLHDDDLIELIKKHTGRNIKGEASLRKIDNALTEL